MTASRNGVYLLHRTSQGNLPPTHHAIHYLGSSHDIAARLSSHRAGNGSNLVRVWNEAGAEWVVARLWLNLPAYSERTLEARLESRHTYYSATEGITKRSGSSHSRRLCPVCAGKSPVDILTYPGGVRVYAKSSHRKAAIAMMKRYGKWDTFTEFETVDGKYGLSYGASR